MNEATFKSQGAGGDRLAKAIGVVRALTVGLIVVVILLLTAGNRWETNVYKQADYWVLITKSGLYGICAALAAFVSSFVWLLLWLGRRILRAKKSK